MAQSPKVSSSAITATIRGASGPTTYLSGNRLTILLTCGEKAAREITLDLPTLYAVSDNSQIINAVVDMRTIISRHKDTEAVENAGTKQCAGTGHQRRTRIYCAGPMTGSGNPYANLYRGLEAGAVLLDKGYAPYIPHLTAILEMAKGARTRAVWLELDRAFLLTCDALLRLRGESPGAEKEVIWAREAKMEVYYSLDSLIASEPAKRPI
jgi:hypothetical protein